VASILLFDDVWAQLEESSDSDIVAVAPSRDVLLFTGSNQSKRFKRSNERRRDLFNGSIRDLFNIVASDEQQLGVSMVPELGPAAPSVVRRQESD
jgi:hypothetical protein